MPMSAEADATSRDIAYQNIAPEARLSNDFTMLKRQPFYPERMKLVRGQYSAQK